MYCWLLWLNMTIILIWFVQLQRSEDVHIVVNPGTYAVSSGVWGSGEQQTHVVHVKKGNSVDVDFVLWPLETLWVLAGQLKTWPQWGVSTEWLYWYLQNIAVGQWRYFTYEFVADQHSRPVGLASFQLLLHEIFVSLQYFLWKMLHFILSNKAFILYKRIRG